MTDTAEMSLGDHRFALRLRDFIVHTIKREVRKLHPDDTYGTVVSVDYPNRSASCFFGTSTTAVPRPFNVNCQPVVGDVVRVCGRASNRYIAAITSSRVWIAPTLTGTWAAGSPAPQFVRDAMGFVRLRGILTSGTGGTSAFTLPAECTPSRVCTFDQNTTVTVGVDGTVTPTGSVSTHLDGIVFDVN